MATKEEFVESVKNLPGVGPKTAEKLYSAGFTSIEKLKQATVEDLVKDNLVGKKTAEAIVQGLQEMEAPAEAQKIQVREERTKAERREDKVEVKEPEQIRRPKIKPQLTAEAKQALAARAERYANQPEFKRYHWFYKRSLERNPGWRRPRGPSNKQRRGFAYRPPRVKVGYGKPAVTRGLHPSGFAEVFVYNVDDLAKITDPKTQAARIGSTVGGKKHIAIEAKAAELKIRVLNPAAKPTTRGAK